MYWTKAEQGDKMEKAVIEYEHHGSSVKVREDLKGLHRDYCLCFRCKTFVPSASNEKLMAELQAGIKMFINKAEKDLKSGCSKSAVLYAFCREMNMTTPVWECPECEAK